MIDGNHILIKAITNQGKTRISHTQIMPFEQTNRLKSAITKQATNVSLHLFGRSLLFELLHEFPEHLRDVAGMIDFYLFFRLARVFKFNFFKRTDLDPGYRIDADK